MTSHQNQTCHCRIKYKPLQTSHSALLGAICVWVYRDPREIIFPFVVQEFISYTPSTSNVPSFPSVQSNITLAERQLLIGCSLFQHDGFASPCYFWVRSIASCTLPPFRPAMPLLLKVITNKVTGVSFLMHTLAKLILSGNCESIPVGWP